MIKFKTKAKGLTLNRIKYGTILTCQSCKQSFEVGDMRDNGHSDKCRKKGNYWQCGHGWSREDLLRNCPVCKHPWIA